MLGVQSSWQAVLLGLITGIIATLLADNSRVRFSAEKLLRKLLGKPLISVTLSAFLNSCSDGDLLIYCFELKNTMWLTSHISKVYMKSYGDIPGDSYAYKPLIYFRSNSYFGFKKGTMQQVISEYSNCILPYTPDNPNMALALSQEMPISVVIISELIPHIQANDHKNNAARAVMLKQGVGELRLAVPGSMPKITPGASWYLQVISEDFGFIDRFHIIVPKDLESQKPLKNLRALYKMEKREAYLCDLGYEISLRWPLRFNIDGRKITVINKPKREIKITKTRENIYRPKTLKKHRDKEAVICQGIKIQ